MDNEKKLKQLQEKVNLIFCDIDNDSLLEKIKKIPQQDILKQIFDSGLRGRGGAGFPTGIKWKAAGDTKSNTKYVICNADEGEPGTFKDRKILNEKAGKVFMGMALCSKAIGSNKGYIYLRGEYNFLVSDLSNKLAEYNKRFKDIGLNFSIDIFSGSGAYVCGEETSLIESMEGNRGEPRNKPPFPVTSGYMGKPTVINNVETFAYAAMIINDGPDKFKNIGTKDSKGSKVFSISGDANVKGIYELPLGMSIEKFSEIFGDGDTKAVQVGGSSGFCVPRKMFSETVIGFEGMPTGGSIMLFNSKRSMYHVLKNYLEFFEEESCGQCTPCRVGCQQLLKGIEAIKKGDKDRSYLKDLRKLADIMTISAKCGLGQSVVNSFNSITSYFEDEIIY